jgi:DNA repair exonuclease SbcCD ATPase subunit
VKAEFGLTEDYFKIGKVGSNTTNFIQFTTTERKEYISMFVEPVQKYISAFDIVSEKVKNDNKQIAQVTSDLSKYDSLSAIAARITQDKESLKGIEAKIDSDTRDIAGCDAKIAEIDKAIKDVDYTGLKSDLLVKKEFLRKSHDQSVEFEKIHSERTADACSEKIKALDADISAAKSRYDVATTNLTNENTNKISVSNNIAKTQSQISGKSIIDPEEINTKITGLKTEIQAISARISGSKLAEAMKGNEQNIQMYLDSFKNFMLLLEKYYSDLNDKTIIPTKTNAELFFGKGFAEVFNEHAHTVAECIKNNTDCLENKNSEYATKTSNLGKLDILAKRPAACTIDDCPFISDALRYKNLPQELTSLEKEINAIKQSLSENTEKQEKLSDINQVYSQISKAYVVLKARENIVFQYFLAKNGNLVPAIMLPLNEFSQKIAETVTDTENTLKDILAYKEDNAQLSMNQIQYNGLVESEKTRKFFEKELSDLNESLASSEKKISEINQSVSEAKTVYDSLTQEKTDYSEYLDGLNSRTKTEKEVSDLDASIKAYETKAAEKANLTSSKQTYSDILASDKTERTRINEEITSMAAAELTIKQLNEKMASLNKSYDENSTVKNALSPKSGIPLIFIKAYLDGTEHIANDLLNIAYNGKFEIKFVPTAKDFFIQVRSGDNVVEDIKYASQGEIAMTTISLSLALIERSLGDFNILYLDEIDGPLDAGNRESFISILNKQIKKLNLEQIFVISHNNAFDECGMNLITLPGSEERKNDPTFMKNKTIIFDATESN